MTQQEIQNFLKEHPGYLKWGKYKIANKLGCRVEDVKEAKRYLKGIADEISFPKDPSIENNKEVQMPKILLLDIETSPLLAYTFSTWKTDIHMDRLISDFLILSWSAKWFDSEEVFSMRLTPEEVKSENDTRIVKQLWNLLNECDIVIGHNQNSFDLPRMKSKFLVAGLPPTTFYHQIDTMLVAKKEFGFTYNKLDFLAQKLGLGAKIHTEFELWARCMRGEEAALQEMERYNRMDVILLEKIYLKLRPYIKCHPNVTLYSTNISMDRCTSCGSDKLTEDGFYYTSTGQFPVYRCGDCGGLVRGRKAIKRAVNVSNLSLGR